MCKSIIEVIAHYFHSSCMNGKDSVIGRRMLKWFFTAFYEYHKIMPIFTTQIGNSEEVIMATKHTSSETVTNDLGIGIPIFPPIPSFPFSFFLFSPLLSIIIAYLLFSIAASFSPFLIS